MLHFVLPPEIHTAAHLAALIAVLQTCTLFLWMHFVVLVHSLLSYSITGYVLCVAVDLPLLLLSLATLSSLLFCACLRVSCTLCVHSSAALKHGHCWNRPRVDDIISERRLIICTALLHSTTTLRICLRERVEMEEAEARKKQSCHFSYLFLLLMHHSLNKTHSPLRILFLSS